MFMPRVLVVAIVLCSFACKSEVSPPDDAAPQVASEAQQLEPIWGMYRDAPSHTGMAVEGESLNFPLTRLWRFYRTNVGIHTASKGSPTVDERHVYVGADNERFYAVDKNTGELVWRWDTVHPCKYGIHSTPAVDDTRVYIGDYAGYLSALNKMTGALVWEAKLGDSIGASPTLIDDTLYVGVETSQPNGYVSVVNKVDGKETWRSAKLGDHTHCTPTVDVDAGRVYLGSNTGAFQALSLEDGQQIWRFRPEGYVKTAGQKRPKFHAQIKGTAAIVEDKVLFTSWDHRVYSVNANTGEQLWNFKMGARAMSSPSVDVEARRVYVGSHDFYFYALDLDSGKQLWKFRTGGRIYSSAIIVPRSDGKGKAVIVGSFDQHIYAFDDKSGEVLWKQKVRGAVTSVPVVQGGRLYVSTNGGELLAFE